MVAILHLLTLTLDRSNTWPVIIMLGVMHEQLLLIFSTAVSLITIILHYYSDSEGTNEKDRLKTCVQVRYNFFQTVISAYSYHQLNYLCVIIIDCIIAEQCFDGEKLTQPCAI